MSVALPIPVRSDGSAKSWALFLDVDGTLIDHIAEPAAVVATDDLVQLLSRLLHLNQGAVAVVSGRSIADLDRIFACDDYPCAGQHGQEIRGVDGRIHREDGIAHLIDVVMARLMPIVSGMPGVMLENKGLSLTLHYRRAAQERARLERTALTALSGLDADLQLVDGNHAFEVKSARCDKGKAILRLMAQAPFRKRTPVFVGDDRTDEDGFLVVNELHGFSIKVGPGPTIARWRAADTAEIRVWLQACAQYLEGNVSS